MESKGLDIVYSVEVRLARRSHCWVCVWNPEKDIVYSVEVRVARRSRRVDYVWNPGQAWVCNGLSTGLEVSSRFLSVRLCGQPRVWLARWVLDSPRGSAYKGFSQ